MLLRPDQQDLRVIGGGIGRICLVLSGVLLVPAALALLWGEHNEAASFVIAAALAACVGLPAELAAPATREAGWHHGLVIAAIAWLVAPLFGAVPLHLSGHYLGFGDAYFDAMSGFATAGLAVVNDLDHLARSVNLWRHGMQFLGGQGLVLIMLSMFPTRGGAVGMYAGEAHDQKILPNVIRTARFIWRVALVYFVFGTSLLWITLLAGGVPAAEAGFHAVALFMAAFDTGGFAPTSAAIGIYHSPVVELALAVLMVAGALSFALHHALWRRRFQDLWRATEARYLAFSLLALFTIVQIGLVSAGTYPAPLDGLRQGLFQLVSAHTGTGFNTLPGRMILTDWGRLAPAMLVLAMGIGAMAGSTAGGIKIIRLVVVAKSIRRQIRELLLPDDAVVIEHYHSHGPQVLRDHVVRAALLVLLLYISTYLAGALMGMFYGYPFDQAMFESTSATAAVGLSVGVVGPGLPAPLKVTYILQMWAGRLEFVAVLALAGFAWSALRGRA